MDILDNYNLKTIEIIDKYGEFILNNPNIIGIGRGNKIINGYMTEEPSLTFFVTKKLSASSLSKSDLIPNFIDGVKTDVYESGGRIASNKKIYRQQSDINELSRLKSYYTPSIKPYSDEKEAYGGGVLYIDNGNETENLSYATMTYAVTDRATKKRIYYLANRNLLDPDDNFRAGEKVYYTATVDKNIYDYKTMVYYGMYLGRTEKVSKYKKVKAGVEQKVDAGIGYVGEDNIKTREKILAGLLKAPGSKNGRIITSIIMPEKGMPCYQIAAQSGYIEGAILTLNTTQKMKDGSFVEEGATNYDLYTNQIVAQYNKEAPKVGDTGALGVLLSNNKSFGMNNGCSKGGLVSYSHIKDVFDDLQVEFLM